jgi:DNA-binding transcriptional LysR family regulator
MDLSLERIAAAADRDPRLRLAIRLRVVLLWPRRGRRQPAARAFIEFVRDEAGRGRRAKRG